MKTPAILRRICGLCAICVLAAIDGGATPVAEAREARPQPAGGEAKPGLPKAVTVRAQSGRSFVGEVDARSDATELWLRSGGQSLGLVRPIDWDRVREVVLDGKTMSGSDFQRLIATLTPKRAAPVEAGRVRRIVLRGEEEPSGTSAPARPARPAPEENRRVSCLAIDVWGANWDADPEVDGLVVEVAPCDAEGRLVPVRGTLEVNLFAQRRTGGKYPEPFDLRQRWTEAVRPDDFGGGNGARYRLAFAPSGSNPEFDLGVARYGAVVVELSVPGQGTFTATASSVRLRPPSPVRDALERATGGRFFPGEHSAP